MENPFLPLLIDALSSPEVRGILEETFTASLQKIQGTPAQTEEDLCRLAAACELTGLARQSIY